MVSNPKFMYEGRVSKEELSNQQLGFKLSFPVPGAKGCDPPGWEMAFSVLAGCLESRLLPRLISSRAGDASITLAWH